MRAGIGVPSGSERHQLPKGVINSAADRYLVRVMNRPEKRSVLKFRGKQPSLRKQHDAMELEIVAWTYRDGPTQMVRGCLIRRQLIEVSNRHVTTEIQGAILSSCNGESSPWIELSEDGSVSLAGLRQKRFVVILEGLWLATRLRRWGKERF